MSKLIIGYVSFTEDEAKAVQEAISEQLKVLSAEWNKCNQSVCLLERNSSALAKVNQNKKKERLTEMDIQICALQKISNNLEEMRGRNKVKEESKEDENYVII